MQEVDSVGAQAQGRERAKKLVVFVFLNMKGGVGKTTLALNLAELLALKGYRVLFIDMDGQGSATAIWKVKFRDGLSIVDVLRGNRKVAEVVVPIMDNLDILPSHGDLFLIDFDTEGDRALVRALEGVTGYDIAIVDSPPALGVPSLMALGRADKIIVPVGPSILDVNALFDFIKKIAARKQLADLLGVVLTRTQGRRNVDKRARATLQTLKAKGIPVLPYEVPEATLLMESLTPEGEGTPGMSIFRYRAKDNRRRQKLMHILEGIGKEMVKYA